VITHAFYYLLHLDILTNPKHLDLSHKLQRNGVKLFEVISNGMIPCMGCGHAFLEGVQCENCNLKVIYLFLK